MPRVLVMAERTVGDSARTGYLASLAHRRTRAADAHANFWVFEQAGKAGAFLEFVEAGSVDALTAAIAAVRTSDASERPIAPVWQEVTGG